MAISSGMFALHEEPGPKVPDLDLSFITDKQLFMKRMMKYPIGSVRIYK